MRRPLVAPALALTLALPLALPRHAASAPSDLAARGLDVFVHVPTEAAPGAVLPVELEALGFPTVVTLAPLAGAAIEAGWDPEWLGPDVAAAPPSVRAVADADGRARLEIPVPRGEPRVLKLLVAVQSGAHRRTRTLDVRRTRAHDVSLHVPDTRVVPGGETHAWVLVTEAATGVPVANAPVLIELVEGGVARHAAPVVTDAAGTAVARVPIPASDDPSWAWTLRARSQAPGAEGSEGSTTLTPREETPGTPRLDASFADLAVRAGDPARWVVRVRDASDKPVAALPVRTWVGPKGTKPPTDPAAWERASTLATTDAAGEIRGVAPTPTLVASAAGTRVELVAKATVEGRALDDRAGVDVGAPTASAEVLPEGGAILPGAAQRFWLRVRGRDDAPVAGTFTVEADGLAATVTTDARGEAELAWQPPTDVGGRRDLGPCAGGVAASVRVRAKGEIPALGRAEPFDLCLPVDRESPGLLRAAAPVVRAGDPLTVRVVPSARGRADGHAAWTLVGRSSRGALSFGGWMKDGLDGGALPLPAAASGLFTLSAAAPRTRGPSAAKIDRAREPLPKPDGDEEAAPHFTGSPVVGGAVLVVPRVLPRLAGALAGGRAAPGGTVEVDVALDDGHGRGLPGTVAAVLVDRWGGGTTAELDRLDTRASLCRGLVPPDRCDELLEGGAAADPMRRAALASEGNRPLAPAIDPGPGASAALREAFASVVRSLEGAVYEAAQSADRLRDVGRRGPGAAWSWNPELLTLVTAAMDPPPTTPGGEPITMADLAAIDPQVTFDHVARRVTRLKLFRILEAVRDARRRNASLEADEPALRDPNALLRRLVRTGGVAPELLLDPWGGTIRFGRATGPAHPFLGVARGFELRAPGPDGVFGNGDDVRDPFERVLASGTPYARAMGEDRVVDARLDMEVGDATVSAWRALLDELTGTQLGSIGHGSGTGTGAGYGSGHGRLGGSHVRHGATRVSHGVSTGVAWWSPPQRTDAQGRLRLHVPLGDAETTWRLALVGVPDGATPATTAVDIPVSLPIAARVEAGATWTEGDEIDVAIVVRNGGAKPARATVEAEASGAARLVGAASRTVDVPASGSVETTVRVAAPSPGLATIAVRTRADGAPEDRAEHTWEVRPAGERVDKAAVRWVTALEELSLAGVAPLRATGAARLRLERGPDTALAAALEALDPDRLTTAEAMADAVEVATRVARSAVARHGERSPVALRAGDVARRAEGRLAALEAAHGKDPSPNGPPAPWAARARALLVRPPIEDATHKRVKPRDTCPPKSPTLAAGLDGVEAEPPPANGTVDACWDAYVTDTVGAATSSGDPVALARLVLALADRPHRDFVTAMLADRLREKAALDPMGRIALPGPAARDRASRAIVHAALLRAVGKGTAPAAPTAETIAAWALAQRDTQGGYGSPLATRSVVRALLSWAPTDAGEARATVHVGDERRTVTVAPGADLVLPLPAGVATVRVEPSGAPLLARLEQPMLRPWWQTPDDAAAPARLEVAWPERPVAGETAPLRLALRHTLGRATTYDARIPLPPGVALAAPVSGVRQLQGALVVRAAADASPLPTTIELPLRFGLAGKMTVPEARVRLAFEDAPRGLAPARAITVAPRRAPASPDRAVTPPSSASSGRP